MAEKEEKLLKVVPPCNKKTATLEELLMYCFSVDECAILDGDKKEIVVCSFSFTKQTPNLRYCLWRKEKDHLEKITSFILSRVALAKLIGLGRDELERRKATES